MILLPKCLRLQGMTPASIIVNCVPNFIGPIMIAQWAFQNRPAFGIGPSEINLMIVTIYLSCILSILFIFIYPRLVSMEQKKENRMPKVCTLFVWTFPNWSRPVQTCLKLFKLVWSCSKLSENIQIGQKLTKMI